MNAALAWALDLFYPPKCVMCQSLLKKGESGVCAQCRVDLPENRNPIAAGRFFNHCIAPFQYRGQVRDSLLRYKFEGRQSYARYYGEEIAKKVLANYAGLFDVISWVPVSRRRRAQRGFDQARLLAHYTAKALGLPLTKTLIKVKNNARQSSITDRDERRGNVRNAYRPYGAERWRGKRVLLIDDIITSGATLDECSGVLRLAGAAQVLCAVAATARNQHSR